MSLRSLLLFEPSCAGHYLHYVRRIADEAAQRQIQVHLITSPESARSEEFGVALRHANLTVVQRQLPKVRNQFRQQLLYLGVIQNEADSIKPDHILIPFGNNVDKAIAFKRLRANVPWSLVVMRDRFHLSEMKAIGPPEKRKHLELWMHKRILANPSIKNLFTIDPLLAKYSSQKGYAGSEKVVYVPDPISPIPKHNRLEARERMGVPANARTILVYGGVNARKGLDEILRGMAAIDRKDFHLLIVGKQYSSSKPFLSSESANALRATGRLTEIDAYVDDQTEALAFSASDAVWVGYQGHFGQSGVLFQAASAGLPCVATFEGLIGYEANRMPNGSVFASRNVQDVRDAISRVLAPTEEDLTIWKRNAERLTEEHQESRFKKEIFDALVQV